jgi:hypothetical protein
MHKFGHETIPRSSGALRRGKPVPPRHAEQDAAPDVAAATANADEDEARLPGTEETAEAMRRRLTTGHAAIEAQCSCPHLSRRLPHAQCRQ